MIRKGRYQHISRGFLVEVIDDAELRVSARCKWVGVAYRDLRDNRLCFRRSAEFREYFRPVE